MSWTEGEDYYISAEGWVVFTEKYHLRRGYCCSNGCLHCPFGYDNVPEPKRTQLLHEREQKNQQKNIRD